MASTYVEVYPGTMGTGIAQDPNTAFQAASGGVSKSGRLPDGNDALMYVTFDMRSQFSASKYHLFRVYLNLTPYPGTSGWFDLWSCNAIIGDDSIVTWNNVVPYLSTLWANQYNNGNSQDIDITTLFGWIGVYNVVTSPSTNGAAGNYQYWLHRTTSAYPRLKCWLGKLPGIGINTDVREITVYPTIDATGVDSTRTAVSGPVSTPYTEKPGISSNVFSNIKSGTYTGYISYGYNDFGYVPDVTQGGIVVTAGTVDSAPNCIGDQPTHRQVTILEPPSYYQNNKWFYRLYRAQDNGLLFEREVNVGTGPQAFDTSPYGNQGWYATVSAKWNDGDQSGFSAPSAVAYTTTPTITGQTATSTENRQITVTWNRISQAANYTVVIDANLATQRTFSVPNPSTGTTVSYTITQTKSGPHAITISPTFTNGYQALAFPAIVSGTVVGASAAPKPNPATIVGNSPFQRSIQVTAPSAPSAFFSADSWEVALDTTTGPVVTMPAPSGGLVQVKAGNHTVLIRAKWNTPLDFSQWSNASNTVATTTPAPTSPIASQRSAPLVPSTCTINVGGGTIPAGTYLVSTSIAKNGNGATNASATFEPTRLINESNPSDPQTVVIASASSITVTQPTTYMTGASDTWSVFIGTDRNNMKAVARNIAKATTTQAITAYTAPSSDEAKRGKMDLSWTAPASVTPTSYVVERAPNVPPNDPTGVPSNTWVDASPYGIFWATTHFSENSLDTKFWNYRVRSRFLNSDGTFDVSATVDVVV